MMKSGKTKKVVDKRNSVCTAIGKSLKAHRLDAEISQEQLAFSAEVDRTYISQIERGVANPSVLTLGNLCFGIGITLADLFASVDLSFPPDDGTRRSNNASPEVKPKKSRLR